MDVPGLNNPGFKESPSPQYIAYDSAKDEIFVSNLYGNCITVISAATNKVVTTIDLGNDTENNGLGVYPVDLAYDSAKSELFVVTPSSNSTSIISDATDTVVGTKTAGPGPFAIVYDPAKGELFVTNPKADTVTILSDATASSATSAAPASSSSFPLWILVVIALVLVLVALVVERRRRKHRPPPSGT